MRPLQHWLHSQIPRWAWRRGTLRVGVTRVVTASSVRGAGLVGCAVLAHLDLVCRPHASRDSPSMEDSPEEGPSFSGDGHDLAPTIRSMEPARLVSGRDAVELSGISQAVIDTSHKLEPPLWGRPMLWSGVYSLSGVPLAERTLRDARLVWCFPSCRKSWSGGCPPPLWRCMSLPLRLTTMQWTVLLWGSITYSSGSWEVRGD